jgi:hypothetical protein
MKDSRLFESRTLSESNGGFALATEYPDVNNFPSQGGYKIQMEYLRA